MHGKMTKEGHNGVTHYCQSEDGKLVRRSDHQLHNVDWHDNFRVVVSVDPANQLRGTPPVVEGLRVKGDEDAVITAVYHHDFHIGALGHLTSLLWFIRTEGARPRIWALGFVNHTPPAATEEWEEWDPSHVRFRH
jgi:hypothetical protein